MDRTIQFADTEGFYADLKGALDKRESITIETSFERYDDVPQQLRDICALKRGMALSDGASGLFVVGMRAPTDLNVRVLYVIGAAAAGAGIGAAVGGIPSAGVGAGPGAAVGAAIGAGVGVVAAAVTQGKFDVELVIDAKGRLTIRINPK
ncbi:MAG: hypothetical protein L6Q84_30840 [Polyangiaceae bacterium]|nr:hypothetical protein [Polyangiaceae bacterium]MCK6575333.1 hypothetical protein [Myxococcota bacterium]